MTAQERETLQAEIQKMIDRSKEVEWAATSLQAIQYEKGMQRGLERALSAIQDLDAIMEDNKRRGA